MRNKKRVFQLLLVFIFLLTAIPLISFTAINNQGSIKIDPYLITGTRAEQYELKEFFHLLATMNGCNREQFAIIREIANAYIRQGEFNRLINFLYSRIHQYPEDPYTAYYLFMIAFGYQQLEAYPVAALYFDMIVKNYPDLEVLGQSIHLASLKQLITLVNNPQQQQWYYEELISRFLDQIDPGPAFFMLGQAYERVGEWDRAIRAYTQFLPHAGSHIPGFPDAENYARHLVGFHNSAKDWTFNSLDALVRAVTNSLDAGSPAQLRRNHARVNFFTRTWEQEVSHEGGVAGHAIFNLSDFMRGSRIRYADSLHVSSNANEAFFRTWGWSQNISVWYLYFRRIYFPMDPTFHGNWEWAGIYFGEKF